MGREGDCYLQELSHERERESGKEGGRWGWKGETWHHTKVYCCHGIYSHHSSKNVFLYLKGIITFCST